jgi:integrase
MSDRNISSKTGSSKMPTVPDDFPLRPHIATGQWRKTIRGKDYYFGKLENWKEALDRFTRERPFLERGQTPPPATGSDYRFTTVHQLATAFSEREKNRQQQNRISASQYNEMVAAIGLFNSYFGSATDPLAIDPTAWGKFRHWLENSVTNADGTSRKPPAASTLKKMIGFIRSMSKWASHPDILLIDRPLRFGEEFPSVSKKTLRVEKHAKRRSTGARCFTAEEIRRIFEHLSERKKNSGAWSKYAVVLESAVLLGLNGGFYQSDVSELPKSAINFDRGLIDFDRVKTRDEGIVRIVPMWDRTARAIRDALAVRPKAASQQYDDRAFLTRRGVPYRQQSVSATNEAKLRIIQRDALGEEFAKVLNELGMKRDGLAFGALRHTFNAFAGQSGDVEARNVIMGHAMPNMQDWYEQFGEQMIKRCRRVTEFVEKCLFPSAAKKQKKG